MGDYENELILFAENDYEMMEEPEQNGCVGTDTNKRTVVDGGSEEYESEEDDGITIIGSLSFGKSDAARLEDTKEITKLVEQSLNTNLMGPTISFIVDEKYIICQNTVKISTSLRDKIWKKAIEHPMHAQAILPQNVEFIEKNLQDFVTRNYKAKIIHANEIVGFLGTHYIKMGNYNFRRLLNSTNSQLNSQLNRAPVINHEQIVNTKTGCEPKKFFNDFCLIVFNRLTAKIIDYSIHGSIGNINTLITKYSLTKIFHNDDVGKQLYNFLTAPCSPFYPNMNNRLISVRAHPEQSLVNAFCPIACAYCAYCKTLQTMFGFFAQKGYHHLTTRERMRAGLNLTVVDWFEQTPLVKKDRIRKTVTRNLRKQSNKHTCIQKKK
ncbi:uncharacterized protein LOC128393362 [Panonychus citri]|uniref:uncharacterized protein LOC128393362 n=1 Tax=Panonychus citri TaxID=50023 RepID=UPI002307A3F5|nr:uncharacterized protein LOC128393362 [Panonychus citri]